MQTSKSTLINHVWSDGEGPQITSFSPDEKDFLWQAKASSAAQVAMAIDSARQAFPSWRDCGLEKRQAIVGEFIKQLTAEQSALAETIAKETGKPEWEAATEVSAMINKFNISVQALEERAGDKTQGTLHLTHRPHGVMAVLGPYNFPGHLPNGHIIPALLAGNTVVFKPSEFTPLVGEKMVRLWLQAGLPAGVINLVQGGREVGEALVTGEVNGVLFTGSFTTGQAIHRQLAGRPDVLLALEMGGNNPMVVGNLESPEAAIPTILSSAFLSAGQRCTCTRRLILVESEQNRRLLDSLVETAKRIRVGPTEGDPFMGSLIHPRAAQSILDQQQELTDRGGHTLLTTHKADDSGAYLTPGILDVTSLEQADDKERFGPLLLVQFVPTFDAALEAANATAYGLAAGLLSDELAQQTRFKQVIRAGVVSINLPTAGASSAMPFGGVGHSGNHRPSAYYAADYCAWPQAQNHGPSSAEQALTYKPLRGLK